MTAHTCGRRLEHDHGELVCDSDGCDAEYFERRHSLNARQTRRRVGSSLTTATEGQDDFFRLAAVKHEVIGLSPVLYVTMWSSSEHRQRSLAAGMMTYVSSAYLHSSFPVVAALRSYIVCSYLTDPFWQ